MTQGKALFRNWLLLLLVFGVALLVATLGIQASSMTSAKAQETVGIPNFNISQKPPLKETQPSLLNSTDRALSSSAPATICYTCGGSWPNFNGVIPTRVAATERGISCGLIGSSLFSTALVDKIPYLCTN